MQRGQAETLRMLDDHAAGVGDIDPDLHDARGNKDLHLSRRESRHGRFLLLLRDTGVDQGHWDSLVHLVLKNAEGGLRVLHIE